MKYRIKRITAKCIDYNPKINIFIYKEKYMNNLNNIVTTIINQWDPLDIEFGPEDEYNSEVQEIMELLKFTDDAIIIAQSIQDIFFISGSSSSDEYYYNSFQKPFFDCYMIALYIQDAIEQLKS